MESRVPSSEFWTSAIRARFFPEGEMLTDNALEEEFQAMHRALFETSRRRNVMVSKIYRLPTEVLTTVFGFTRDVWHPSTQPPRSGPDRAFAHPPRPDPHAMCKNCTRWDPGWIKLTQISHHFREIAFDTPSLWTNVNCSELPMFWQEKALSLSRSIPLSIFVHFENGPAWNNAIYSNVKKMLSAPPTGQRQRIRGVTLVQSSPDFDSIHQSLKSLCERPMPGLRELSLVARPPNGRALLEIPIPFWKQLRAPNLERLHVSRCTLSSFPSSQANITYFRASLYRYCTGGTLGADIGPILLAMPRLEVLILSQDEENILPSGRAIILPPSLHTLTLAGPGCARFTSELDIPDTVNQISVSSTPFSHLAVQRLLCRHNRLTARSPIQVSITQENFILVDRWMSREDAGEYRAVHMYSADCDW
ncbi:hypothetical protein OF83DRAFT_817324 [Amylostereum chailletii]|nr:hypothetical protein OF83DRAFT_817324 [Amylostereum chailletii]